MSEIQEFVRGLAKARQDLGYYQDCVLKVHEDIKLSELGQKLARMETALATVKEAEKQARAALDQAVLDAFDGNKRPHPAITVKEMTKLDYDPKMAREWADTNLRSALVLDAKRFEKAILATETPDFVTVRTEKSVAVSTDLSAYVE